MWQKLTNRTVQLGYKMPEYKLFIQQKHSLSNNQNDVLGGFCVGLYVINWAVLVGYNVRFTLTN